MNRHIIKEDIRRTEKHIKRCSALLGIREKQIKAIMRYNYIPIIMAKIKILTVSSTEKNTERLKLSHGNKHGNKTWFNYFGRQFGGFL